jgi:hypothetical protein
MKTATTCTTITHYDTSNDLYIAINLAVDQQQSTDHSLINTRVYYNHCSSKFMGRRYKFISVHFVYYSTLTQQTEPALTSCNSIDTAITHKQGYRCPETHKHNVKSQL